MTEQNVKILKIVAELPKACKKQQRQRTQIKHTNCSKFKKVAKYTETSPNIIQL